MRRYLGCGRNVGKAEASKSIGGETAAFDHDSTEESLSLLGGPDVLRPTHGGRLMILADSQLSILKSSFDRSRAKTGVDAEHQRRLGVSRELHEFLARTNVLHGGVLARQDLADLIRILRQIQNLQVIMFPRLLGTYHFYVQFKDFKGDEKDFAKFMNENRPDWEEGDVGYPGADLADLSRDLRLFLTAQGNALLDAYESITTYPGLGRGFATGLLQLHDPNRFPLVNGASIAPFRKGGACRLSSAQGRTAYEVGCRVLGTSGTAALGPTRNLVKWIGLFSEIKRKLNVEDFLVLDYFFWHMKGNTGPASPVGTGETPSKVDQEVALAALERIHAQIPRERIAHRRNGEDQARELLDSRVGRMSENELREMFRLFNTDFDNGKIKHNRFGPTFIGQAVVHAVANLDQVNSWVERLWTAEEAQIGKILDDFWTINEIPYAGKGFPTGILYLRDRNKYNVWLGALARGLRRIAGGKLRPKRTGEEYIRFNQAVNRLRESQSMAPQVVDEVLHFLGTATDEELTALAGGTKPPDPPIGRPIEELLKATFLEKEFFDELRRLLDDKPQLILYGPPGTGKTFVAEEYAQYLASKGGTTQTVQFHPSYGYEEFVEGIRPRVNPKTGLVEYHVVPGLFRNLCERAGEDPKARHVLVIDEINRGNLPRIFGELLYLIEKRNQSVILPYSGTSFTVPENVFVIGTMNSADHSIALVDMALRRRFHFKYFDPRPDILKQWLEQHCPEQAAVADLLETLNAALLKEQLEKNLLVGHSHFMKHGLDETMVQLIWEHSIMPLLEEYFYASPDKLRGFGYDQIVSRLDAPGGEGTGSEQEGDEEDDEDDIEA